MKSIGKNIIEQSAIELLQLHRSEYTNSRCTVISCTKKLRICTPVLPHNNEGILMGENTVKLRWKDYCSCEKYCRL